MSNNPVSQSEPSSQVPGIDFVVSIDTLRAVDLCAALAGCNSVDCLDLRHYLENAANNSSDDQAAAFGLLASVASSYLVADHATEPFKPMLIMEGKRTLVPSDLMPDQIAVFAELVPELRNLALRSRMADVVWFCQRWRHDMANIAIGAYCEAVAAVRSGDACFSFGNESAWGGGARTALVRAARISYATRWGQPACQELKELLTALVTTAVLEYRTEDFCRIAQVALDYGVMAPERLAGSAEHLLERVELAQSPELRSGLLQFAASSHKAAGNQDRSDEYMKEVAECHVQKAASARSRMLKAAFLHDAIQMLRHYPNTRERRDELATLLRDEQEHIHDEMTVFSTEINLEELVEHSVASVRGHSWPTALLSLVLCAMPPQPEDLRDQVLQHAREFPMQADMPIEVHDLQGRLVFRSPGTHGAEPEGNQLRLLMAQNRVHDRKVAVAGQVIPIRRTITAEHPVGQQTILALLHGSPFVPAGHAHLYATAISHFLAGEDVEALSILVPQLENSLRHILLLNGHDTTAVNADGIQTAASLPILLNPDRPWRALLEEIISPAHILEVDLLFDFAGGPAVRNQVAHGNVQVGSFYSADFIYAAWLIIHLAVLPMAHNWGDVEETFARVTGLRRRAQDHADAAE